MTESKFIERRSPERLKMEQQLRAYEDWLESLDIRVENKTIKGKERNRMTALALLKRDKRLEREQSKTELERNKNEFDPMTGLYRQEHLRPEIERRISLGLPFAILFTDLDHFGEINKEFGQPAGDEVIIEAAFRLTEGLRYDDGNERNEDKAYRNGGDENAIILSGVKSQEQLRIVAERIRIAMESAPFHIPIQNKQIPLTVSIGGAIWENETMGVFMNKAGLKLVEAKKDRNIVKI